MRSVLRMLVMLIAMEGGVLAMVSLETRAHDDGRVEISPSRDLTVPSSWAGEWRITTTYRRGDTHEVVAVDEVTDVIRAGEPVGMSALARGGLLSCRGAMTDRQLDVSCATTLSDGACELTGAFAMVVERAGETLVGSGEATGNATSACGAPSPARTHTTIEVIGSRLSGDQGDPVRDIPPLLIRFVASNPLLLIAARASLTRPIIKDDCKDGGFRAFEDPSFKNQGQCIKFVEEQERLERDHATQQGKDGRR